MDRGLNPRRHLRLAWYSGIEPIIRFHRNGFHALIPVHRYTDHRLSRHYNLISIGC